MLKPGHILNISLIASLIAPVAAKALPTAKDAANLRSPIPVQAIRDMSKASLSEEEFLEITADEVYYNQEENRYEATGEAEVFLVSDNAYLHADQIIFDGTRNKVEAIGNVRINQGEETLYGNYAQYDTKKEFYSLNSPKMFLTGVKLKARIVQSKELSEKQKKKLAKKVQKKNTAQFKEGIIALDEPVRIFSEGNRTPTRYSQSRARYLRRTQPTWQEYPEEGNIKYSAEEITFDNTRKLNNLQIKGARIWISDKISIPSPVHITTTVGKYAGTRFTGPVIGTRERLGGFSLGPRFYKALEHGVFSWAPIVQIGNGPGVGGGLLLGYSDIDGTLDVLTGYGSLENRFIINAEKRLPKGFRVRALMNQFSDGKFFGSSQVGQLYDINHRIRLKSPLFGRRGLVVENAVGWAKDNDELFSSRRLEDLLAQREDGSTEGSRSTFRSEHSAAFYTRPLIRFGNSEYNFSLAGRAQGLMRFYGTGDTMLIGRVGPSIEMKLDNLSFETLYLVSGVSGESPLLFDQFIDGEQALIFDGDYKINKHISIGAFTSYNLKSSRIIRNQLRTEFGAEDFKLRFSYDTVRNQIGLGVNMLLGDPIKYKKLNVNI